MCTFVHINKNINTNISAEVEIYANKDLGFEISTRRALCFLSDGLYNHRSLVY